MELRPNDAASLRARYERAPNEVLQSAWSFSYWRHGGEPGPDWLSDKLDLSAANGQVTARYIRTRNDQAPPFSPHAEEFTGAVPANLAESLLRALIAGQLFERTLPAEGSTQLADALQLELELSVGSLHLKKHLYEPQPAELGDLGPACEQVMGHLKDQGAKKALPTR